MTKTLRALFFIQFFNLFTTNLLGPVYAVYVSKIGGDLLIAGGASAAGFAVIGTLIFISGKIAARFHTEKLQLIIGYSIGLIVTIGYLLITSPAQLFVLQVLLGVSVATSQPAYNGLFSSRLGDGSHASRWGTYFAMTYYSGALAALASGFISQMYGFHSLFYAMIVTQSLGLLGTIRLYFMLDEEGR